MKSYTTATLAAFVLVFSCCGSEMQLDKDKDKKVVITVLYKDKLYLSLTTTTSLKKDKVVRVIRHNKKWAITLSMDGWTHVIGLPKGPSWKVTVTFP